MSTTWISIVGLSAIMVLAVWFVRHQRSLKRRAELMQEAIHNHDFMFRLPTNGLLPGERAMQESLNQLGNIIRQQMNQNEVESWERLTRVLTHEIMNATAPIASISQAMLRRDDVKGTPLEEGIHAIHTTANHLNSFVDSYRKLSQWQQPVPEEVDLADLLNDLQQLYPAISWQISLPTTESGSSPITVYTDQNLLRQVLINLTKNAIEAGAQTIGIEMTNSITAKTQKRQDDETGETLVYFSNDGAPIPAEARQSIFVPFFTTKRTGTGIGLSLSRRILIQQGGGMELAEHPRTSFHTTFLLWFPKK